MKTALESGKNAVLLISASKSVEAAHQFPGLRRPNFDQLTAAAGGQKGAGAVEHHTADHVWVGRELAQDDLVAFHVPDPHALIIATRSEQLPGGIEIEAAARHRDGPVERR